MRARTLGEDLRAAAIRDPDRVALVTPERSLTYAEFNRLVDGLASRLRELGVGRGDRVAIVLPNGAAAAIAIYGALRAGAAFSPLNPTIKHEKLGHVLSDSGAAAVLCDPDRAETVRAAVALGPEVPVVTDVEAQAEAGGEAPIRPVSVDLAAVIYTSGSTGDPKGVTLTHANMTFAADSIIEYLGMEKSDIVLCMLPLSFDYGLYQLLMCTRLGATLILEPNFAFPGRIVQLLESEGVTGLPGVPTVFQVLLSLRGLADRELPALRFLTQHRSGAARADRGGDPPHLPQRAPVLDVRADGVQARDLPAPGPARRTSDLGRHPDPGHRGLDRGRPTAPCSGPGRSGS